MAAMAPMRETEATELRLGNRSAMRIAMHVNTKNHWTPLSGWAWHVSLGQTVLNSNCMVLPPVMISITQLPPDRYITGNNAATLPALLPTHKHHHFHFILISTTIHSDNFNLRKATR